MKRLLLAAVILISINQLAMAQAVIGNVNTVVDAEKNFNKLVERKGIKDGFLAVADPEGIVFKPNPVNITEFYTNIDKQAGTLTWTPNFARVSINADLAFTAGPYVYQNRSSDTDKVFGDYVSIWKAESNNKWKLLIDLGIQHPEPETVVAEDFKNPDSTKNVTPSKDPFKGKQIIMNTDNLFNHTLTQSTLACYQTFLSPDGRYYFPGFEPITGQKNVVNFIQNESISISAQTIGAGRSTSNDLAYTYGKARIKKGEVVSDYNYVRIWQIDSTHNWNIALEIFSAIEND